MQEATQGIAIVKAFTMESQLSRKMAVLVESAEGRANKIARVSERVSPIAEVLAGFAIAGVIAYAGYRAADDQQPPGAVCAFITANSCDVKRSGFSRTASGTPTFPMSCR